jgi:hypothetical protein
MAIPEQIKKQTEAVQKLYEQLNMDDNTGEEADGTVTDTADEYVADDSANTSTAVEQRAEDTRVPEENILQKYKTLQGMYNAEVPRLHQQNREMAQRVQQMEQLLASLSAQQRAAQQPEQAVSKYVTDEDVQEYGDSIEIMRKVSKEEFGTVAQRLAQLEQVLQQMQSSVVPQVQNLAYRQNLSAEQQFWSDLGAMIPNFREINGNEGFQKWLLEVDPLTNITRQTYLEDAQRNNDARRVANFFYTWLEKSGQVPVAQPSGRVSHATSELEMQVAPGRSRSSGTPTATANTKVYTPQDIEKFFSDVRKGKYKGREQERSRIERDIFAAQRENRIQMSA